MILFNIPYYNETQDREEIYEVAAYSEEQALFIFNQHMSKNRNSVIFVLGPVERVNKVSVL